MLNAADDEPTSSEEEDEINIFFCLVKFHYSLEYRDIDKHCHIFYESLSYLKRWNSKCYIVNYK